MSDGIKRFHGMRLDRPDEDRVIVAFLLARSMGEFVSQNLFAASLKRSIERSRLFIYWRNDRPFKGALLSLNGHVSYNWGAQRKARMPLDAFDDASGKPVHVRDINWFRHNCHRPDLVLTPSMMRTGWPEAFPAPARFTWKDDQAERLDRDLRDLGLNPSRWFCVIADPGSPDPDAPCPPLVDRDPGAFGALTRTIIEDLGGQVLRVGFGELPAVAAVGGRCDLDGAADRSLVLARAMTRARCLVEIRPSGLAALAHASDVPVVSADPARAWAADIGRISEAVGSIVGDGWRTPAVEAPAVTVERIGWPLSTGTVLR